MGEIKKTHIERGQVGRISYLVNNLTLDISSIGECIQSGSSMNELGQMSASKGKTK